MPLDVAVVGAGRWGTNILRTLAGMPGLRVNVVHKGETARDADAVIVATPSETHAAVALPYIERGIPTFIEKPMATSLADAERIRDAASRSGATVFVGHIHLFNPAFRAAQGILRGLGPLRTVMSDSGNDRRHGSLLWEWLPHDLSLVRELVGAESDTADAVYLGGASDAAAARFAFSGVTLHSRMDAISPVKHRRTVITAADGTLILDDTAERKLVLHRGGDISYPDYELTAPLEAELAAFICSVHTGEKTGPDAADGLAIVRMIAAADASAQARLKTNERYA